MFCKMVFCIMTSAPAHHTIDKKHAVVTRSLIDEVLTSMRNDVSADHLGIAMTYYKIRQHYFWQGMYKDIMHWIETCTDCTSKKSHKRTAIAPMQIITIEGPFDRVCVDVDIIAM